MVRGAGLTCRMQPRAPRAVPRGACVSPQRCSPMSTEAAPPPPSDEALEAAAAQEAPADADAMAELAAANQHLTFAQQPMVQNVLPFVTSVAIHVGILIIAWVLWDNR